MIHLPLGINLKPSKPPAILANTTSNSSGITEVLLKFFFVIADFVAVVANSWSTSASILSQFLDGTIQKYVHSEGGYTKKQKEKEHSGKEEGVMFMQTFVLKE